MKWIPVVSVVIPCRNEALFIGKCLDSILSNDYPHGKIEILVVDGMSQDGTREITSGYCRNHSLIRLLDNEKMEVQLALNIGITSARGEVIVRMDAHSIYKENYITECVKALNDYPADNVGGCWITVPRDNTLVGRAICFAMSVPFGVGNAYYRLRSLSAPGEPYLHKPQWEIIFAYFCCRKELFDKVGLFNERLDRSEDIDFRARLKRGGYRSLFVPGIVCYYSMRTKYFEFLRHMVKNGIWVILPVSYAPGISFSLRHVAPLFSLISMIMLVLLSGFYPAFKYVFWGGLSCYFATSIYFSARVALREKHAVYFFILPFIFISIHTAYGVGSVLGLFLTAFNKMKDVYNDR